MTEEYFKSRRQLVMWSGILFAFQTVGLDLESLKSATGTLGTAYRLITRPDLVPFVIIVLVGYFLVRFAIEYFRCDEASRRLRVSRVDAYLTAGIALSSLILFGFTRVGVSILREIERMGNQDWIPWAPYGYPVGLLVLLAASFWRGNEGAHLDHVVRESEKVLNSEDMSKIYHGYHLQLGLIELFYVSLLGGACLTAAAAYHATSILLLRVIFVPLSFATPVAGYLLGKKVFRRRPDAEKREIVEKIWRIEGVGDLDNYS